MLDHINAQFHVPHYFVGVLDEQGSSFHGTDGIYNFCSISKFITTLLCLKLVQQGDLSLTSPVLATSPYGSPITLEMILRHETGIIDDEHLFQANRSLPQADEWHTIQWMNKVDFRYSDHAFVLLEQWLQYHYKKPFITLLQTILLQPLGLHHIHVVTSAEDIRTDTFLPGFNARNDLIAHSYAIYPFPAACGMWGRGSDLLILMAEVIEGLNGNSALAIPADFYHELIRPSLSEWVGLGCFLDSDPQDGLELSSLGWGEGAQCLLAIRPQAHKGLLVLTNKDAGVHQMKGFCGAVYHEWHNGLLNGWE